jgi:hypothetical protein
MRLCPRRGVSAGPLRAVNLDHRDPATTAHLIRLQILEPFANKEAETW